MEIDRDIDKIMRHFSLGNVDREVVRANLKQVTRVHFGAMVPDDVKILDAYIDYTFSRPIPCWRAKSIADKIKNRATKMMVAAEPKVDVLWL